MFDRDALISAISVRYDDIGGSYFGDHRIPGYIDYVLSGGHCDGLSFDELVDEVAGIMLEDE